MVHGLPVLNMVDYLLLSVAALCAISGLRQGFITVVGKTVSIIIGLVLAFYYYDDFTAYIEHSLGLVTKLDQFLRVQIPFTALVTPDSPFVPGSGYLDPLNGLARWVVSAICFLLLLVGSSQLIKFGFACFKGLTSIGLVSGINHLLGMTLALLQGILIACVLVGFTVPVIHYAAQMGMHSASVLLFHLNNSVLVTELIQAFHWGQAVLGFKV